MIKNIFHSILTSPNINARDRQRLNSLYQVWDYYCQFLYEHPQFYSPFIVPEDMESALKDSFLRLYNTDSLTFYGFYDFNAIQENFVSILVKNLTQINFFIPGENLASSHHSQSEKYLLNYHAFTYLQPRLKRWLDQWGSSEKVTTLTSTSQWPSFLFDYQKKPAPLAPGYKPQVIFWQAKDPINEVESVVLEVKRLISEGVAPEQIGIVVTQPSLYRTLLEEDMIDAGIPFRARKMSLIELPAVRYLLGLLSLDPQRLIATRLLAIASANAPWVSQDREWKPGEYHPYWEKLFREALIVCGDKNYWWKKLGFDNEKGKPSEHQRSLHTFLTELFEVLEDLQKGKTWNHFCETLNKAINKLLINNQETQLLKQIIHELYLEPPEDIELSPSESLTLFGSLIKDIEFDSHSSEQLGVSICSFSHIRGLTFQILFLIGASSQWLPQHTPGEGILPNRLREQINRKFNFHWPNFPLNLPSERSSEERLIFALCCSSVQERIYFTYPKRGIDGKLHFPSRFLLEVARVINGEPILAEELPYRLSDNFKSLPLSYDNNDNKYLFSWKEDQFFHHWAGEDPTKMEAVKYYLQTRESVYSRNRKFFEKLDSLKAKLPPFSLYEGIIREHELSDPVSLDTVSVSSLLDWIRCPMLYLFRHLLQLTLPNDIKYQTQLDRALKGKLIHHILYEWVGKIPKQMMDKNHSPNDYQQQLLHILGEIAPRYYEESLLPLPLWEAEIANLRHDFMKWFNGLFYDIVDNNAEARYLEHKLTIDTISNIVTNKDATPFKLNARIDRLEWINEPPKIRIVDYKLSSSYSESTLEFFEALQMSVYMMLVECLINDNKIFPIDFPSHSNIIEASIIRLVEQKESQIFTMRLNEIREEFSLLWEEIKCQFLQSYHNGIFPPIPIWLDKNKKEYFCNNCEYSPMCPELSRLYLGDQETFRQDHRIDNLASLKGGLRDWYERLHPPKN
ncbi:MAG: PD-(D/E)XK nuclease family protein [bacterium]